MSVVKVDTFSFSPVFGTASALLDAFFAYVYLDEAGIGASIRKAIPGEGKTVQNFLLIYFAVHVLEASVQARECIKYKTGTVNSILWVLSVLVLGFPQGQEFKKLVGRAQKGKKL